MTSSALSGVCAQHPQTPAVLTCERCGDFACAECVSPATAGAARFCKNCSGASYEELRKEYGPHERQLRAIALLNWIGAVALALSGMSIVLLAFTRTGDTKIAWIGLVVLPLAGLSAATAWQLQRFTSAGRIMAGVSAAFGLCSIPFGTLISIFMLWAVFGKKGEVVFSQRYRDAIAATPHLKYGVSMVTKILLGVLVLLMFGGAIAARLSH